MKPEEQSFSESDDLQALSSDFGAPSRSYVREPALTTTDAGLQAILGIPEGPLVLERQDDRTYVLRYAAGAMETATARLSLPAFPGRGLCLSSSVPHELPAFLIPG